MKGNVIGIGGVFFRVRDSKEVRRWYREHLGIEPYEADRVAFPWQAAGSEGRATATAWGPFDSDVYGDSDLVINYCVRSVDAAVDHLQSKGVKILRRQDAPYGRFAWFLDGDARLVELYEATLPSGEGAP